jgi:hypothetical protein
VHRVCSFVDFVKMKIVFTKNFVLHTFLSASSPRHSMSVFRSDNEHLYGILLSSVIVLPVG